MINCKECQREVEKLALFPGDVCLDCYAAKPANSRVVSASELTAMWGGGRR